MASGGVPVIDIEEHSTTGLLVLGVSADMGRDWYGGAETCWDQQLLLLIGRARHNLSAWSLDPNVRLLYRIECCIGRPGSFMFDGGDTALVRRRAVESGPSKRNPTAVREPHSSKL